MLRDGSLFRGEGGLVQMEGGHVQILLTLPFVGRCRSSYKVFSDLPRKQYTKQQNNGP